MSVLGRLAPETKDVPDDAVVPLADDELEGERLSHVTAAHRARKLGSAAHDEGAEPQDLRSPARRRQ